MKTPRQQKQVLAAIAAASLMVYVAAGIVVLGDAHATDRAVSATGSLQSSR